MKRGLPVAGRRKRGVSAEPDAQTKGRLLAEGTRLFADRGYQRVTVRDICSAAKANVAAINYHFGGKTGLYEEVLRTAVRTMAATTDEIVQAGSGQQPEEQLATFIRIFLQRVTEGRNGWIHRLMMHEMQDPTAALDLVVDAVIRPRMAYLVRVVAGILGCPPDDRRVLPCAASVQAQVLMSMRSSLIGDKLGVPPLTLERVQAVASHIAVFSIAGIRAARESR